MQQLRELVEITQNDMSLRPLADPDGQTMMGKLYRGILSGSDVDEAQIVEQVYGKGSGPSLPAYQKLKSRLRNVLLDALLDVSMRDKPDYSTFQQAYHTLQRQYASAQVLIIMRAYHNCAHVLERVYRRASKFGIVELQYQSSQRLASFFLGTIHNPRKFVYYNERAAIHREAFLDEGKVMSAMFTFKHALYNRMGSIEEIAEVAQQQANVAESVLVRRPDIYKIRSASYLLRFWAHFLSGALNEAIVVAKKAEDTQRDKKGGIGQDIYSFRVMQYNAYGLLRKPEEARLIAKRIESDLPPGTINWLDFQEKKFFHFIHQKMYQDAFDVVTAIDKKKVKKLLKEKVRQLWELIDAIIYLLHEVGLVDGGEIVEKFRLNRFLNSLPTYVKEKRGMNVQVLIIHTILLIVLKRYDEAIDRVEALEKYCSRHLRNNDQLRSNCFIKMLTSVVKGNFHVVAAQRYADQYLKKLRSKQPSVLDFAYHTELIAYETLWEILISHLGNKVYTRKYQKLVG